MEKGNTECVKVLAEAVAEGRAGAGGASSGAAAAAVDAPLLGQRVVLGGLSAHPELNGQRGVARASRAGGTRWRSREAARACGCGPVICRQRRSGRRAVAWQSSMRL